MPRPRRPWIKLHTNILNSSLNYELKLAEQAVFIKLICLAAEYSNDGSIVDGEGQTIPHSFLAHRINADLDVFEEALKKCIATNRISENSTGLHIVKWREYQSEYLRQKPYRKKQSDEGKTIHKVCSSCGYKALTSDVYCPRCLEKGEESELQRDYTAGKYGNMVQR